MTDLGLMLAAALLAIPLFVIAFNLRDIYGELKKLTPAPDKPCLGMNERIRLAASDQGLIE